jgi:hypothetical protein
MKEVLMVMVEWLARQAYRRAVFDEILMRTIRIIVPIDIFDKRHAAMTVTPILPPCYWGVAESTTIPGIRVYHDPQPKPRTRPPLP